MPANKPDWILGPRNEGEHAVMPTNQVHIIAGSSGAGKTTLLFQMIKAMTAGEPFLGCPTAKHEMVYVAYDRDIPETESTMQRVGISQDDIPAMSLKVINPISPAPGTSSGGDKRFEDDMRVVRNAHPNAKVIIIDGFYTLIPYGRMNDYLTVAEFLQRVRSYCSDHGLTILGVCHSPKQREGNKVTDPRQMILGSVAGGGFTSCGIVIIRERPDSNNSNRNIYVLPRNAAEVRLEMGMTDKGILTFESYVPANSANGAGRHKSPQHATFVELLDTFTPGEEFNIASLMKQAGPLGLTRPSVVQWLNELTYTGSINRVKYGTYCVAAPEGVVAHNRLLPAPSAAGEQHA